MIQVEPDIQALIFDCDGTLADSMPVHMKAWEKALVDFGAVYHEDFLDSLKGMNEEEIVQIYNQNFNLILNPKKVVDRKHHHYLKEIHHIKPILPVTNVVKQYAGVLPMAVVSGGRKVNVYQTLEVIDVIPFFPVILTADDPVAPKPAPDIFLEAAKRLDVEPGFCLVFEDGDLGLEAAQKAGMKVVDVRFFYNKETI